MKKKDTPCHNLADKGCQVEAFRASGIGPLSTICPPYKPPQQNVNIETHTSSISPNPRPIMLAALANPTAPPSSEEICLCLLEGDTEYIKTARGPNGESVLDITIERFFYGSLDPISAPFPIPSPKPSPIAAPHPCPCPCHPHPGPTVIVFVCF